MASWNLEELRSLVKEMHGVNQLKLLQPHINSLDWKIRIAAYHSYTFAETFSPFFENEKSGAVKAVKLILSSGEEASKFREAKLIAEANIIACAQSTHSVSDILSYVIIHSLKLSGIDEKRISISEVNKILSNGALKKQIERLLGLKEYRYLQDFVNTTKHISLVFSEYSVDLQSNDDDAHGIKFKSFSYKDRRHPEKWAEEFVQELRKISIEFVQIGRAINESVRLTDA